MKQYLLHLLLLLLTFNGFTQEATSVWKAGAYYSEDNNVDFYRDSNGNFYHLMQTGGNNCALFNTTTSFNSGGSAYQIFTKLDSNMQVIWCVFLKVNTFSVDRSSRIVADNNGNVYLTADYADSTWKFNSLGQRVWRKHFGGGGLIINEQGNLEIFHFSSPNDSIGGQYIYSSDATVVTIDTDGNYLHHFMVNDANYWDERIFGKNEYGYFGFRRKSNNQQVCSCELFICDSIGNFLDAGLINYNHVNNDVHQVIYDPEFHLYYVTGYFNSRDPFNTIDSTAASTHYCIVQLNSSLEVNGFLGMCKPLTPTVQSNKLVYMTCWKGDLYVAGKATSGLITHLGIKNCMHITNDQFFMAKLDYTLRVKWYSVIPNQYFAAWLNAIIPAGNGIYCAGYAGSFSYGNVTFSALGGNDAFVMKVLDHDNTTSNVRGRVFCDVNQNGIDDNEQGVWGHRIFNDQVAGINFSNADGRYRVSGVTAENIIRSSTLPVFWHRSTPDSVLVFSQPDDTCISGIDFGIYPMMGIREVEVGLTNTTVARVGRIAGYRLTYKNNGSDTLNGNIILIQDSSLIFHSSNPLPDTNLGDTIIWNYSDLNPNNTKTIDIVDSVKNLSYLIGTELLNYAMITPIIGDTLPGNNVDGIAHEVVGSAFQNQLTVSPSCDIDTQFILDGKYLEYRIDFQNNGSDTVHNITVKDTLSAFLDLNSIEITETSHSAMFEVENNVLSVFFPDIMLPDSGKNLICSNGYFKFKIKVKTTAVIGSVIKNRARIYFDYNLGSITNGIYTNVVAHADPVSIQVVGNSCPGASNGQIIISNSCVDIPSAYSLDGVMYQNTNAFVNLLPGYYQLWVNKLGEIVVMDSIFVPDALLLIDSVISIDPLCYGYSDGQISVNAVSSNGGLQYQLNSFGWQSSDLFSGLDSGLYLVSISDANNCIFVLTDSVELTSPPELKLDSVHYTPPSCYGYNNGSLIIFGEGGTQSLSYAFDSLSFQPANVFNALNAGVHTAYILDSHGCIDSLEFYVDGPAPIAIIDSVEITSPLCYGGNDGMILIHANSAIPIEYSINGSGFQFDSLFAGLAAGLYHISFKDTFCLLLNADSALITQPDSIAASFVISPSSGINGSIQVIPFGGTGDYMYALNGIDYQVNNLFDNLSAGNYNIWIMDYNGCVNIFLVTVPDNTGTTEFIYTAPVRLFPNPIRDNMIIESSGEELPLDVKIFDMVGKIVYSRIIMNSESIIDFSAYVPGIYVISIAGHNNRYICRLVKI